MIARTISTNMLNAIESNPGSFRIFIEIFTDPVLRIHSGLGERDLLGNTYIGVGELLTIGEVKENTGESANRFQIGLYSLDPTFISTATNDDLVNIEVSAHLVCLDDDRKIAAYQLDFYNGEITDKEILPGDIENDIPYRPSIECSDWHERWSQPVNAARCTDEAQQELYPGDKFFDQVEILAAAPLSDIPVLTSGGGGGGGGYRGGGSNHYVRLK